MSAGSVFKRCGCRGDDGKQVGTTCPRLRTKGHGSWTFVVGITSGDGKRKQHSRGGFRTKAEATAEMDSLATKARQGIRVSDRLTVGDWLDFWLREKTKPNGVSAAGKPIRPTTSRSYRLHVETYLKPSLGPIPLDRLTGEDIASAYDGILDRSAEAAGRPMSAATLRRIHATLASALSRAVKTRRLPYNPAQQVDLPAGSRPLVRPWEPAELGAFLDHAANHRFGIIYEVIAATGLRRGEALGLRWADVDPGFAVLTVNQQLVDTGSGPPTFGPPKTAAGHHRRVELDQRTTGAMLLHRITQDAERDQWGSAYEDQDLVFAQENGRPYDPGKITKTFTSLARDAGLRTVRLHDLRHGAASLMLAAGVPVGIVSKRLGHSSITLTNDTYQHMLAGVDRQAAEAAAALVPRGSSTYLAPTVSTT